MKKFLNHIWSHVKRWNEYFTIPIAFLLWYISSIFLRWIDPTAATYDSGIFQVIFFTIIQFLIYNGIVWIAIKLNFPGIYNFLDNKIEENFENEKTTTFQKMIIVVWVFTVYFLGIVILSRVI